MKDLKEKEYQYKENNPNLKNTNEKIYKADNSSNNFLFKEEIITDSGFITPKTLPEKTGSDILKEKPLNGSSQRNSIVKQDINLYSKNMMFESNNKYNYENNHSIKNESSYIYKKRRFWDDEEDEILRRLVDYFGDNNWKEVAEKMEFRNSKQCAERWLNHLAPDISHKAYTPEEDEVIIVFYFKYGGKWKELERILPYRSTLSLKNRFNSSIKKKLCKQYRCSPDEIESAAGLCRLWNELLNRK